MVQNRGHPRYSMERPTLVCGLYRSGTTYLQTILDPDNKHTRYKHEFVKTDIPDEIKSMDRVIIHKSPYKWIDSIISQSWELGDHYKVAYEKGHTEIRCATSRTLGDTPDIVEEYKTYSLENICDLYNRFFHFWLSDPFSSVIKFVKYRDLISDPMTTLKNLTGADHHLPPSKVSGSFEFTPERKRMALDPRMSYNMTPALALVVKHNIDKSVLKSLNYTGVFE